MKKKKKTHQIMHCVATFIEMYKRGRRDSKLMNGFRSCWKGGENGDWLIVGIWCQNVQNLGIVMNAITVNMLKELYFMALPYNSIK